MFWKRAGFEGGEREIDLLVHAHCIIFLFFLCFLSSFLCFLSYLFLFFLLFSFTLLSFYTMNALYFSIPFSGHDKGPFIVPAVTSFLPLCPLTAFVWSERTCRPPKGSSMCHSPLPDKGRFVSFVSPPQHSYLPQHKCFLSLSLKACT